ncbi:MAG: acyl-CoA dehydrogenase family protein [Candidatus Limnocylindrales bacterium]
MTTALKAPPAGGAFLLGPTDPSDVFTPERFTPEHLATRAAIGTFVAREVAPRAERIAAKDYAAHRELLAILGRDGYLGIDVPEAYGGLGLDHVTSIVVTDALSAAEDFSVTYSAHSGIGTLPTVFFGTEEQKRRYLPGLAAGTLVAAYCLTEPGTGSDAQAIKTRATRLPGGSFRLDGAKQFITNAGFADLFTVYAQVEGEGIAAFLVERTAAGLSLGAEEHKMGLHGTSTRPVLFDGVVVGPEALLGEIGEGHKIAFNVLNVGRFKLAAGAVGGMRPQIKIGLDYAQGRVAFGRPIVEFPLVAGKLVGMAVRTYAVEALVYRLAGMLDARLHQVTADASSEAARAALEEYAVECSIAKVLASEEVDWVVDELVQLHGGYGYIEDYPAAKAYRDARINRIWEGTNEINRLLIPGTLLRRAMKGRLDLLGAARRAQEALLAPSAEAETGAGPLAAEATQVDAARQVTLLIAGAAVQRFGAAIEDQQEVLAALADLVIQTWAMDSAVARARQAAQAGGLAAATHADLAQLAVAERLAQVEGIAQAIAPSVAEGDDARLLQAGVRRLLRAAPLDRVALSRRVAARIVTAGGYPV